ncbi:MAG TPA: hotdog fold thioesterase [Syntrophomonadaceae bacterium]|nr:hotdog fold thioesterase [Syntrophomonadaceae bacterium]
MNADYDNNPFRAKNDPLARHLGITLLEVGPGYAKATMESKPELLNALGITHGAALFALTDVTFGAASNSHGPVALALDVHISFVKATQAGEILQATAREENLTFKTGLYRMEVTDKNDQIVAIAEGRVIRKA